MDLRHSFTVSAGVDETWTAFQDIESVAECFPGAQITSADQDSFEGTVKVKLGPIALVYKGSGTFTERDAGAHRMVIDAKGKDKRGNGTAGALVTVTMTAAEQGTQVEVATDLSITGKPAQFGRGVIQDVSDKLLGQFVDCLQAKVGAGEAATPPSAAVPTSGPAAPVPHPVAAPAAPAASPKAGDDSLDLGAAVLPVMARTYWKQALAAVAGLVLLRALIKRILRR